jgi:hypothetical protein
MLREQDTALGKARNEAYMTTGASNAMSAFPLVRSRRHTAWAPPRAHVDAS